MCHNRLMQLRSHQQGSSLVIVIFIIIVFGLLGLAMVRLLSGSTSSVLAEVGGTRAMFAANSSIQSFLTELFPLDEDGAAAGLCVERQVNTPPPRETTYSYPDEVNGLAGCSAELFCDRLEIPAPYTGTHFRITAQGSCPIGDQVYVRELSLEATDGTP